MVVDRTERMLPLEIVELIMEQLAKDTDSDAAAANALKASALACRDFLSICRRHIFSSITLDCQDGDWSINQFRSLLETSSTVATQVRSLEYFNAFSGKQGTRILSHLHRVRELSIGYFVRYEFFPSRRSWKSFSSAFRYSFHSFIRFNNIVSLAFYSISDLPMYILWSFPNLVLLGLFNTDVASENRPKKLKGTERPLKLSTLRVWSGSIRAMEIMLNAGQGGCPPVFDLSGLQHIYVETQNGQGGSSVDFIHSLLRSSRVLHDLRLTVHPGLNSLETLSDSLNEDSLRTLKKIQIGPIIGEPTTHPYLHFTQVLEKLAGKNVLEEVVFDIVVETDSSCAVDPLVWEQLDVVLSADGFPFLHRVIVEVRIDWYLDGQEEFHSQVEGIGNTSFMRLKGDQRVDFTFTMWLNQAG